MDDIIIRAARVEDARAIAALHVAVWRKTYRDLASPEIQAILDEEHRFKAWAAKLSSPDPDQASLVAEAKGRIVAIGAAGAPGVPIFGGRGEIKHLYVDPAFKRQGLGRRLMMRLATHLRDRAFPGAAVSVVRGNDPAMRFYRALNGRQAGEYVDPGPVWRSHNIVFAWDDAADLISALSV